MKCEKREHPIYKELKNAESAFKFVGRWQYIYSSEKGKISLIYLPNYLRDGINLWEIYCLEGDLFDDIERFKSKSEAEKRIKEMLG